MRLTWIAWVSRRFLTGRPGGRSRLVFIFSVLFIALGVMTLNSILAVMNGNQQGFIRSILEIGSYHIRWYADGQRVDIENLLTRLNNESEVKIAAAFREGQTLLIGSRPRPLGTLLRGLPEDIYTRDRDMAYGLRISSGVFDISNSGIVLGEQLAFNLGLRPGDRVKVLNLSGKGAVSESLELSVNGLFRSDYREYESALAFVSLESARNIFGDVPVEIGIKLLHPRNDQALIQRFENSPSPIPGTFVSWRESNRAFFGALRTEKAIMLLLLTLIFVVVSVNIDHFLRKMAAERIEDLAILKALGASPGEVRVLFLRHALVIGGCGGILGTVLGVLTGKNVDQILLLFQRLRSFFPLMEDNLRSRAMRVFFESSQVLLQDVLIIFFLALLLTFAAAIRASSMAAKSKPAEVLRSE